MKKLLIAGAMLCSIAAIKASTEDNTKYLSDKSYIGAYNDTLPTDTSKKDTVKLMAYNVSDTTPTDTSKKDSIVSLTMMAYAVRDTTPTDTSKKDTSFRNTLAYAVRDTTPTDTSKKDTTLALLALK